MRASDWTIVHDFCHQYGGAERVTETVARRLLPDAPVIFLGGSREVARRMGVLDRCRFLLPPSLVRAASYRQMAPLYVPWLARMRPLRGNVLASSYAFAHHLRCTGREVVLCHSPLRQIWSGFSDYRNGSRAGGGPALAAVAPLLRRLDRRAARHADVYLATSREVSRRVWQYYGIEAAALVPPAVDTALFRPRSAAGGDYFLWAGRMVEPYKRLGIVLEAFRDLDDMLVVAGSGRDERRLRAEAPPNAVFVGERTPAELADLYRAARAVIFPSTDDFGIVPVESMACGTPVIAHRSGGALDTVVDGTTGVLFDAQTAGGVRGAVERFRGISWDPAAIAAHAATFGEERFVERLERAIA